MAAHLGKAFGSLAALTLLSRLSGFVRVAVFAAMYGGGREADVFLSAMLIPELMYRFVSEGLVAGAAVPMFVRSRDSADERQTIFWTQFWGLSAIAIVLTAVLWIPAAWYCRLLVPGFLPDAQAHMAGIWRSMSPYVLFSLQAAVITACLQAAGQFARPAVGPILVNLVIIGGILIVPVDRLELLGLIVTFSGFVQVVWLLWLAARDGIGWRSPWSNQGFRREVFTEFVGRSAPIAGWVVVTPVVPLIERYLLSFQAEGSVSILNYTDKILYLPLGIVSLSLASVVFPRLSEQEPDQAAGTLARVLEALLLVLFPAVLVMHAGAAETAEVIFARGRFAARETLLTAELLSAYAIFLVPASITLLINRLLYASGWYKTTLFIGLAAITAQVAGDTVLVGRLGPVGVGWGAVLAGTLQVTLLLAATARIFSRERCLALLSPVLLAAVAVPLCLPLIRALGSSVRSLFPAGPLGSLLHLTVLWATLQAPLALYWLHRGGYLRARQTPSPPSTETGK
ncbi:MAG TPA: lipid II flippase MurJ [Candidatus Ozemobacteraceae bacterium]|nr:lipid II flippase MurJ [Candidatus Ozemobacteraceae bacterium]